MCGARNLESQRIGEWQGRRCSVEAAYGNEVVSFLA